MRDEIRITFSPWTATPADFARASWLYAAFGVQLHFIRVVTEAALTAQLGFARAVAGAALNSPRVMVRHLLAGSITRR